MHIIDLTSHYIGLRTIFFEILASELRSQPLEGPTLSGKWRESTSCGNSTWKFFLDYAAYFVTASDHVTKAVEICKMSDFGLIRNDTGCVTERLKAAL